MANILLHSLVFPPDSNSNAFIFADIALELQKYGHTISVITTTPHYNPLKENLTKQPLTDSSARWLKYSCYHGIRCFHIDVGNRKGSLPHRLKSFFKFHLLAFAVIWKEKIKADVVIAQSPPLSIGLINGMIAKILHAKSIYIVQDIFPDGSISQGKIKSRILIAILRFLERRVYSISDGIIVISARMKELLTPRIPPRVMLSIIPNFVDTKLYYPIPYDRDYAQELHVEDKFIISYVGNIGNAHDLSPILHCAKKLKALNIVFLIVGDGMRKKYFEDMARQEGLNNVIFLGYVKREDTPRINSISSICLLLLASHIRGYSFPSKIYTLLAMEKPVISVCHPECPLKDFVEENQVGWAVPCGNYDAFSDLVEKLYKNPALIPASGTRGVDLINKSYTKEIVGSQYHDFILRILREKADQKP